ncbi:hypothetical protein LCGC14_1769100, partial [marine sediment metagenome]
LIESANEIGKLGVFSPVMLSLLELWVTKARALKDTASIEEDRMHKALMNEIDPLGQEG